MLKITGGILVICAASLLGMERAERLREQYRQTEYLRQLFLQIQSEIRYARSPLGEIYSYIGRNAGMPYGAWLLELGERLKKRDGGSFVCIWKTSIGECLKASALTQTELLRLLELGERLGTADVQFQVNAIELYLTQLAGSIDEMRREMKTKVRLYHCLGVMSGMLIVTLLF